MNKTAFPLVACLIGAAVSANLRTHAGTVTIQADSAAAGSIHNRLGIWITTDTPVSGIDMQISYDRRAISPTEVLPAGPDALSSGLGYYCPEPGRLNLVFFDPDRGSLASGRIPLAEVVFQVADTLDRDRIPVGINRAVVSDTLYEPLAFDKQGAEIVILPGAMLMPPQNLAAVSTDGRVLLSWDPPGRTPAEPAYAGHGRPGLSVRPAGTAAAGLPAGFCLYRSRTPDDLRTGQCVDTVGAATLSYADSPDVADLYYYHVTALYGEGESGPSNESRVTVDTGRRTDGESTPGQFELLQNYPNPFNTTTTIRYRVPERAFVRIEIYNVLGHRVKTLVRQAKDAGSHRVTWEGAGDSGTGAPTGLYICTMKTGQFFRARKILLLR
ncbi:T9SS type A sorting domain-containing protein [bacterium]|nr:T9SS type A sorting domain-containing protein [bacterium]